MKKQVNLLAILLLLVTLPMYSNDDSDSNNTKERSTGIASLITQASGVVNVGNSCFGRPAGTFEATVMDENGNPTIGASLFLVGTTKGAYIKANGVGTVPNLFQGNYTIKITYAGYSPILDTVNIEYGDTLRKSYKLDEFECIIMGCCFGYERIVDAYEIGSVTTFNSSEIQGRGWGSNNSISRRTKSTKSIYKSEPDNIDSNINSTSFSTNSITFNIRDDKDNKTVVLIDGRDVSNSKNTTDENNISDLIKVYPNPTDGPFTIELEEEFDNLQIIDMIGNIVLVKAPRIGVNQFDLSDFANGTYFLKVSYKGVSSGIQIQLKR
jgi:hypothetical protein